MTGRRIDIIALAEKLKHYGLLEHHIARWCLSVLHRNPDNLFAINRLNCIILNKIRNFSSEEKLTFFKTPSEKTAKGSVYMGRILEPESVIMNKKTRILKGEFGLYPSDPKGLMICAGPPGSGKTTAIKRLITGFINMGIKVMIYDNSTTYRDLNEFIPDLILLGRRDIAGNIFRPVPGIIQDDWNISLSDAIEKSLQITARSPALLESRIKQFLKEHIDLISTGDYPIFSELVDFIEQNPLKTTDPDYRNDVRLRKTLRLFASDFTGCFDHLKGIPLEAYWQNNILFELTVGQKSLKMLIAILNHAIREYRKINKMVETGRFFNLVVWEDCADLLSNRDEDSLTRGPSYLEKIANEDRKYGIDTVGASQQVKKLLSNVVTNSSVKMFFGSSNSTEINKIGSSLNLTKEQKSVLPKLLTGESIIYIKDRCAEPFLGKIDPLKNGRMTEEQTNADTDKYFQRLKQNRADFYKKYNINARCLQSTPDINHQIISNIPKTSEPQKTALTQAAIKILTANNHYTYELKQPLQIGQLIKQCDLSGAAGMKAIDELIQDAFVQIITVYTGGQGKGKGYLAITSSGFGYCNAPIPSHKDNGTLAIIMNSIITPFAENLGFKSQQEYLTDKHKADLVITDTKTDSWKIAIEYENQARNQVLINLNGCLQGGFAQIFFVAKNHADLQSLSNLVKDALPQNIKHVEVCLVRRVLEYLKERRATNG